MILFSQSLGLFTDLILHRTFLPINVVFVALMEGFYEDKINFLVMTHSSKRKYLFCDFPQICHCPFNPLFVYKPEK
nr:hypothetical protein BgiMline_003171 [Biomphalaria glabrata]